MPRFSDQSVLTIHLALDVVVGGAAAREGIYQNSSFNSRSGTVHLPAQEVFPRAVPLFVGPGSVNH